MPGSLVGVVLSLTHGSIMRRLTSIVRNETSAAALLLVAALAGFVWANSPHVISSAYVDITQSVVGPTSLGLDLKVADWAADGLLALFFCVVGLELKHELVAGTLRRPREAALPMLAAAGGMIVPALIYVGTVTALGEPTARHGWAVPTATDIAFAVAVLMVAGRGLPMALRTFLLTLAVVDDLLAIIVIALFYTDQVKLLPLLGAFATVAVFSLAARRRHPRWWLLVPLGILAWWLMHESGVHATIAGVLLGLCVPATSVDDDWPTRAAAWAERLQPWSAGIALPLFAFCAAGIAIPTHVLGQALTSPVFVAVGAGLVIGKVTGVLGTVALLTRVSRLRLPAGIGLRDLLGTGLLTGIGFTVALLIAELSFSDAERQDAAKLGVLLASLLTAALGAIALRHDARRMRTRDMNLDGVDDGQIRLIGDS